MGQFGIGQAVTRIEDQRLLTGGGRYTDDLNLDGQTYAFILRSPHAHAEIAGVDTSAAKSAAGVLLVLTGDDVAAEGIDPMPCMVPITNLDGSDRSDTYRPILAQSRVRHVGEPVAAVIAETLYQARDAAELIEVNYSELPSTTDTFGSTLDGAAQLYDEAANNICFDWGKGDQEATEAAFADAARVTTLELINNRVVVNSMEPRGAIGEHDAATGRSTLYSSSQGTYWLRDTIGDTILKIGKENLRVVTGDVGGGFGMKIFPHPEQPIVVWAARKLQRAVKWTADRSEGFMSDVQGRDHVTKAEMAMDEDGRFLALRVTTYANLGAYLSHFSTFIPTDAGTGMLNGLYTIPTIWANVKGVLTNTVPTDAYRGAGRPEAIYCVERLVDKCARELGIAPDEIRRRNFVKPEQLPYTTALGDTFDSGEFTAIMEAGMGRADWTGFAARRDESAGRSKLRGIGMATYVETCGGGFPETADVKFDTDNDHITIYIGTVTNGQGHDTSYKQIMSDRLGIDTDNLTVVQGDSDLVPSGLTGGSRSVTVGGVAVSKASEAIVAKGKQIASQIMETAVADIDYADATFRVTGTDRTMSLFDVARAATDATNLPEGMEPGLDEAYTHTPDVPTFPNGCHICELEIDPDTGTLEIQRYTVVDDFGDTVNPLLIEGQVHGGIVQGLGQALHEHTVYDEQSGQLVTGSFMDYTLPRADNFPNFDFTMRNVPCKTNPMGLKGSGEAGAIGAPPAVINAIVDALSASSSLVDVDMPATPDVIWAAANRPLAAE
ncbi:MAG: xanthine dehydrogenase family protein molybdopterin-binding subunit [Alphaproteobacteria bacterium]|nr:xanthine dehydrogenase family protein molybdopterin-binding subunit [Alphaproteobacteria bacterium]